jgi:hypothetical protein
MAEQQRIEVALRLVQATRARRDAPAEDFLAALELLRALRTELDSWEPELIATARDRGASWADLATALGLASRQAAERRYLRLRVPDEPAATREDRVTAERDRRAGERAVRRWARDNGADLRQLAGQITALTGLDRAASGPLRQLRTALGDADPTALVQPLADAHEHLRTAHPSLAERVDTVTHHADRVRRTARQRRERGRRRRT